MTIFCWKIQESLEAKADVKVNSGSMDINDKFCCSSFNARLPITVPWFTELSPRQTVCEETILGWKNQGSCVAKTDKVNSGSIYINDNFCTVSWFTELPKATSMPRDHIKLEKSRIMRCKD